MGDAPVDVALAVDVLVTWVGGLTLLRYVTIMRGRGQRSALEARAGFLITMLAALLLVRGFAWLAPESRTLSFLTFVPVTILPLAMTVFVEGLLRRHVPRWMKVFAVVASATALVTNFFRLATSDRADIRIIGFVALAAVIVTLGLLAALIAQRKPSELSRAENMLVRVMFVVTLVALPLAATDFRFDLGWPPVRLGTIGILLLCHALLSTAGAARWGRDVGRLLARAALLGLLIAIALRTLDARTLVPMTVLALAIVLGSAVFDRLRDLQRSSPHTELLQWLARPAATTAETFARELRRLRLTRDSVLLDAHHLTQYDAAALAGAFATGTIVLSLTRLRAMDADPSITSRGVDELIDLLERHGATHVCLVSTDPVRLLVTTSPDLPGTDEVGLSLAAVARHVNFA